MTLVHYSHKIYAFYFINQAARYAPLDQLALSPQCGFASTEEGNALPSDQQRAKLALVVEVAHEVWGA